MHEIGFAVLLYYKFYINYPQKMGISMGFYRILQMPLAACILRFHKNL